MIRKIAWALLGLVLGGTAQAAENFSTFLGTVGILTVTPYSSTTTPMTLPSTNFNQEVLTGAAALTVQLPANGIFVGFLNCVKDGGTNFATNKVKFVTTDGSTIDGTAGATGLVDSTKNDNVCFTYTATGQWSQTTSIGNAVPPVPATPTAVALSCNPCTVTGGSSAAVGNVVVTMSDSSTFNGTLGFKTSGSDHSGTACVNYGTGFTFSAPALNFAGGTAQAYPGLCVTATENSVAYTQAFMPVPKFTPLHTYYISPTGSDSNNGTSAGTPWLTPNHAVVCGDVILAASGDYAASSYFGTWGTVSTCPSSSGGIDGTGKVYGATILCNGLLVACTSNNATPPHPGGFGGVAAFDVNASNWAVEGFKASLGDPTFSYCFQEDAQSATVHHVFFINDVCITSGGSFMATGGSAHLTSTPGPDYFAVVGTIAQKGNQRSDNSIANSAYDDVAPSNFDTAAGPHVFWDNNFAINNSVASGAGQPSDVEGMMFDTWDAHGYAAQGVVENNIIYQSSWVGFNIFQQTNNSSAPDMQMFWNTSYGNSFCTPYTDFIDGDFLNFNSLGNFPWSVEFYDNISLTNRTTIGCNGGGTPYAILNSQNTAPCNNCVVTIGGSGVQNILKAQNTSCAANSCDAGFNAAAYTPGTVGTNTYASPGFNNTTDLLANQIGAPNCSTYTNVTACMGYNANTATLANPSVIYDLQSSTYSPSSKGYQLPSTTCGAETTLTATISGTALTTSGVSGIPLAKGMMIQGSGITSGLNSIIVSGSGTSWTLAGSPGNVSGIAATATFYPYWLKGLTYLQVINGTIVEQPDLVTKPCGY